MIAVTGATGFIGNLLVRELLKQGKKVRVIVRNGSSHELLKDLDVEKVTGDVRDADSLVKAFEGCEKVFHVAGMVSIMPGRMDQLLGTNQQGTRNVVDACVKNGVKRLIYTSSIHAFAEAPHGEQIDEDQPFDPNRLIGNYAKSKALATVEALKGIERGLEVVVLGPTGVIGPHDHGPSRTGKMVLDVSRKSFPVYLDGAYDFVDVRDVVWAHLKASEEAQSGSVYIVGGENSTILNMFHIIGKAAGVKPPGIKLPFWLAQFFSYPAVLFYWLVPKMMPTFTPYSLYTIRSNSNISIDKIKRELGYRPRPLSQTLTDTVNWYREKGRV